MGGMRTHLFCQECGKRLERDFDDDGPRRVKFCNSTCKVANRNARRRQKYAEQR